MLIFLQSISSCRWCSVAGCFLIAHYFSILRSESLASQLKQFVVNVGVVEQVLHRRFRKTFVWCIHIAIEHPPKSVVIRAKTQNMITNKMMWRPTVCMFIVAILFMRQTKIQLLNSSLDFIKRIAICLSFVSIRVSTYRVYFCRFLSGDTFRGPIDYIRHMVIGDSTADNIYTITGHRIAGTSILLFVSIVWHV